MTENDDGGRGPAAHLDALPREEAAAALRSCCAADRWVERMLELRPFGDDTTLFEAAEGVWWALDEDDWLEAFAAHPRIGEREPPTGAPADEAGEGAADGARKSAGDPSAGGGNGTGGGPASGATSEERSSAWSREEQAGVERSDAETRRALEAGNRRYEARFGHVFLVFASGKSGEEMLAELRRRLENDPDEELRIAAGEQAKITRDRLEKLTDASTTGKDTDR